MNANPKTLSWFKNTYGIRLLGFYGVFFSLNDFLYIKLMYSCDSYLNLCKINFTSGFLSSSLLIYAFHILRITSYVSLIMGYRIRLACILILVSGVYFTVLNDMIYSPDIPYIHFLLLTIFLSSSKSEFFKDVFLPYAVVVYLSYSFSGFYKLITPDWLDGTFLSNFIANNHLVYPWIDSVKVNSTLLFLMTSVTLYSEVLAFLAIINRPLRSMIWITLLTVHIGVLLLADIPEVSIGMLTVHFFLLDETTYRLIKKIFCFRLFSKQ